MVFDESVLIASNTLLLVAACYNIVYDYGIIDQKNMKNFDKTDMEICQSWGHHLWASVRAGIAADIERYLTRSEAESARGQGLVRCLSAWLTPELMCLSLYRVSHFFHVRGWTVLGRLLSSLNFLLHKARLPAASCIGPGCRLSHPVGVVFEGSAGSDLTLFSYTICMMASQNGSQVSGAPRMGNQVTLGGHAVLSGDITIGDAVRVSPGAVICSDISNNTTLVSYKMFTPSHRKTDGNDLLSVSSI